MRRNTIVLAVLLVLLAAYVYFFERAKPEPGKNEKLLNFNGSGPAGIVLDYPGREIELRQDDAGRWRLVQPLQAPADAAAIAGLLGALGAADIQRALEKKPAPEDLKNFGLTPPAAKVSLTLKNGLTLPQLLVGGKAPMGDSAYVQRGGDPGVYLTGGALAAALEKEPNDFRDRTILQLPAEPAARLEIQTAGKILALAKDDKEQWTLAPAGRPAKADAVYKYIGALTTLRARAFIDDRVDPKRYGLDRPAVRISLGAKDGKGLAAIEAGQAGGAYYARRAGEPTVYVIDEEAFKGLMKEEKDFEGEEKAGEKK